MAKQPTAFTAELKLLLETFIGAKFACSVSLAMYYPLCCARKSEDRVRSPLALVLIPLSQ
eukprot:6189368-Pleurochrysis_carterae.AAC.4